MKLSGMSTFGQRLFLGTATMIVVLLSIWFSSVPYLRLVFVALTSLLISSAVWEYCQLALHKEHKPLTGICLSGSILYPFAVFFAIQTNNAYPFPQVVLLILLASTFLYYFFRGISPLVNSALTIFPVCYLILPLTCILSINYFFPEGTQEGNGRLWLLYTIVTTKMSDVGGYFFGKQFGRTPLSPIISPKKTWEGTIGGIFCAALSSYFFSSLLGISPILAIILGVWLAILAQFGDLAESLLKRDSGVKDSSHIPGLGGTLDVVDSLIFTLPFIYLFLLFFYGGN